MIMTDLSIAHGAAYGIQAYTLEQNTPRGQEKNAHAGPAASASATEQSRDEVSLSREGKELSAARQTEKNAEQSSRNPADATESEETKGNGQQPLDEAELRQVQQLQQRDTEVRAHEQAHLAVAGQYASGGASFSYQTGPNGKRYAVGGSVPIDIGKGSTPEATIMKMRTIKRAALAPVNPSPADRQIAAQASMQEIQAIQDLQTEKLSGKQNSSLAPTNNTNNEAPEKPAPQNSQDSPDSTKKPLEPAQATRAIMNAAYRAMASLA
jgi:hypothetical protein